MLQPRPREAAKVATLALVTVLLLPAQAADGSRSVPGAARTANHHRTRILLVGDSITMGSAGDWTWRFRLDRQLRRSGARVDLVGPRDDLYDNVAGHTGAHTYANPHFDQDHFAVWGTSLAATIPTIAQVAARSRPDVYVVMLGTNDLAYGTSPREAIGSMRKLVDAARRITPTARFVIADPPHGYLRREARFATLLHRLVSRLSTPRSRVVSARTQRGFSRHDTWDDIHPNARGEITIAAAVSDALARLDVGAPYRRPGPRVPIGPRTGARLRAVAGHRAAVLHYRSAPGVDREYVWTADLTAGTGWERLPLPVSGHTWTAAGLLPGHRYGFKLQPAKGLLLAAHVRSNTVTVVPGA